MIRVTNDPQGLRADGQGLRADSTSYFAIELTSLEL